MEERGDHGNRVTLVRVERRPCWKYPAYHNALPIQPPMSCCRNGIFVLGAISAVPKSFEPLLVPHFLGSIRKVTLFSTHGAQNNANRRL